MVDTPNVRRRRNKIYAEQSGHCWYCGVTCWLPIPGQANLSKNKIATEDAMATLEHQHGREGRSLVTVRQVMCCRNCNSLKGSWTSDLDKAAWAVNGGVRDKGWLDRDNIEDMIFE